MQARYRFLLLTGLFLLAQTTYAQETLGRNSAFRLGKRTDNLFSVALFPPLQWVPAHGEVDGFRINLLYGSNRVVEGVDVGLVNGVTESTTGLALGLVNIAPDNDGLRLGLVNVTTRQQNALTLAAYNHTPSLFGTQLGLLNTAGAHAKSAVNPPRQIGLLNFTGNMRPGGFQLGLLNFAGDGGIFPVMPIINWKRNRGPF